MATLSKSDFLKRVGDLPTKEIPLPELGDGASVRIRCLTSGGRLQWISAVQSFSDGKPGPEPNALLVALAAVDDEGNRLYQVQDADAIAEGRGDVVGKIAQAVQKLSGLDDVAAADAEGNSEATPSGDTQSDSPEPSAAP